MYIYMYTHMHECTIVSDITRILQVSISKVEYVQPVMWSLPLAWQVKLTSWAPSVGMAHLPTRHMCRSRDGLHSLVPSLLDRCSMCVHWTKIGETRDEAMDYIGSLSADLDLLQRWVQHRQEGFTYQGRSEYHHVRPFQSTTAPHTVVYPLPACSGNYYPPQYQYAPAIKPSFDVLPRCTVVIQHPVDIYPCILNTITDDWLCMHLYTMNGFPILLFSCSNLDKCSIFEII